MKWFSDLSAMKFPKAIVLLNTKIETPDPDSSLFANEHGFSLAFKKIQNSLIHKIY